MAGSIESALCFAQAMSRMNMSAYSLGECRGSLEKFTKRVILGLENVRGGRQSQACLSLARCLHEKKRRVSYVSGSRKQI